MDMNVFSIIWICAFCLGGIMSIALSIYLKNKENDLIKRCKNQCSGTLNEFSEELREQQDQDGIYHKKKFYFPIYEFEVHGKKYKVRGTTGNRVQEDFKVGEIVEIKYNDQNPEECYVEGDSFSKVWIIFLVVGIICIIQGIGISLLIRVIF